MAGFTPGNLVRLFKAEIPEFIGTYTYKNGTVTDAISIDTIPNDVTVKGFEIIIPGFPYIPNGVYRTGRRSHICHLWKVEFINHDSNLHGSLARKGEFFTMINNLLLVLPRTTQVLSFRQGDPTKSFQRVQMSIKLSDTYDNRKPLS